MNDWWPGPLLFSPFQSMKLNEIERKEEGWVGLLASLVFWSGGGLWPACRQWLRPKSERRQEEKPINSIQQLRRKRKGSAVAFADSNQWKREIYLSFELMRRRKKESNKRRAKRKRGKWMNGINWWREKGTPPKQLKEWMGAGLLLFS